MPGGDQPVRRRVGGVGDLHLDRALEVGPQQQVRPGIGVDAGDPPGRLGVQCLAAPRWCSAIRARPARNQPSSTATRAAPYDAKPRATQAAGDQGDARSATTAGIATTTASQRVATSIVPCTHQRSGTVSRSAYSTGQACQSAPRRRGGRVADMPSADTSRGAGADVRVALLRARPGPPAAVVRPPRRRRRRPDDDRRRDAGAGGADPGADRRRAGAAGGVRRSGAPAVGAGRAARAVDRERPRHHRRGLPRRDQGAAWSTSTRRRRSRCTAATGSPSWSCSGSSAPSSSRSTASTPRPAATGATVLRVGSQVPSPGGVRREVR